MSRLQFHCPDNIFSVYSYTVIMISKIRSFLQLSQQNHALVTYCITDLLSDYFFSRMVPLCGCRICFGCNRQLNPAFLDVSPQTNNTEPPFFTRAKINPSTAFTGILPIIALEQKISLLTILKCSDGAGIDATLTFSNKTLNLPPLISFPRG